VRANGRTTLLFDCWALNGEKLALVSDRDGNRESYTMTAGGSHPVRLTDNPAGD
jgi:Tol biopolymer transport system component